MNETFDSTNPNENVKLTDQSSGLEIITTPDQLITTLTALVLTTEAQLHDYRRIDRALRTAAHRSHELAKSVLLDDEAPTMQGAYELLQAA